MRRDRRNETSEFCPIFSPQRQRTILQPAERWISPGESRVQGRVLVFVRFNSKPGRSNRLETFTRAEPSTTLMATKPRSRKRKAADTPTTEMEPLRINPNEEKNLSPFESTLSVYAGVVLLLAAL